MIFLLIASILIEPGQIGHFYELPSWLSRNPTCYTLLGNDATYYDATTVNIAESGVIYRDDCIMTNVPMPIVRLNSSDDMYRYVVTGAVLCADEVVLSSTEEALPNAADATWMTQKWYYDESSGEFSVSNHVYWMKVTNWVEKTYSTPHYSLGAMRTDQSSDDVNQNYAATVAMCEANLERLYCASLGDGLTNSFLWSEPVVTNRFERRTNTYERIVWSRDYAITNTQIIGTFTNKTVTVFTSNRVEIVTNIFTERVGPFLDRRFTNLSGLEVANARDQTRERIKNGVANGTVANQLVNIPGSILSDPARQVFTEDGVCHWWSSTMFPSPLMPNSGFTWERFKAHDNAYLKKFAPCGINFGSFRNKEDGSSYLNSNPLTALVQLARVESEYEDLVLPTTNMFNDATMFGLMTEFFPYCLQSRGGPGMQADEDDTWWNVANGRRLGLMAAGMNQLLAIQDRTIHIPRMAYTNVNRCCEMEMNQSWKTQIGTRATVWWNQAKSKMQGGPIHAIEMEETVYDTTNVWTSESSDRVKFEVTTDYTRRFSILGVDNISSDFLCDSSFVLDLAPIFVDPSQRVNVIPFEPIEVDTSVNPIHVKVRVGGLFDYGPFDIDVSGPYQIDVGGSASVGASQRYSYTTNVFFDLGATQPHPGLLDRVNGVKLGTMAFAQYKYEENNVIITTNEVIQTTVDELERRTRAEMLGKLKERTMDVESGFEQFFPGTIYKNGIIPRFALPPMPPEDRISVNLNVYASGYIIIVDYGEDTEKFYVSHTGLSQTNEVPAYLVLVDAAYKYETVPEGDPYYKTEFVGKGNIHPITQTEWKWKAIKAEDE